MDRMKNGLPLLLLVPAVALCGLSVRFHETARVTGPDIRLSEIAEIAGGSAESQRILAGLRVGRAALPGFVLNLESSKIRKLFLDAPARELAEPVSFDGAALVTVKTGSRLLSEAALRDEVRRQVMERMPWTKTQAHISIDASPGDVVLPDMENHVEVAPPSDCDWRGSEQFRVRVLHGQDEFKSFPVTVRIRVYDQVCVAAAKLKRGTLLSAGDLRLETREVTDLREKLFNNPDAVVGSKLSRTVLSGAVLQAGWVEVPPLVHRGDKVRIIVRSNDTEVGVEGTAREDGALGERIRVRNEMTRRTLDAWVSGLNEVELNKEQGGAL